MNMKDHLIHHAFPNLRYKLALSSFDKIYKSIIFAYLYSFVLSYLEIAILLTGFLLAMSLYDQIHYYCHFGP